MFHPNSSVKHKAWHSYQTGQKMKYKIFIKNVYTEATKYFQSHNSTLEKYVQMHFCIFTPLSTLTSTFIECILQQELGQVWSCEEGNRSVGSVGDGSPTCAPRGLHKEGRRSSENAPLRVLANAQSPPSGICKQGH